MRSTKKSFSIALLKIGNEPFTINDFSTIPEVIQDNQEIAWEILSHCKIYKNEYQSRYISLYFEEWNIFPRPPVVYNRTSMQDEDNPRSVDQIERDSQTFILIDVKEQKIFLSDFRKKHTIEIFLQEKLWKQVAIKNIINREEFLDNITWIQSIYLSATPNLFSSVWILWDELTNDFNNYGALIRNMEVKISFQDAKMSDRLKSKIWSFFSQKDNSAIDKLQITWRYDDKFDRIFNSEGIIDKIQINIDSDENGLYDKDSVFNILINEISWN